METLLLASIIALWLVVLLNLLLTLRLVRWHRLRLPLSPQAAPQLPPRCRRTTSRRWAGRPRRRSRPPRQPRCPSPPYRTGTSQPQQPRPGGPPARSAAGHRTDDEQRLASLDDLRWQRRVRRLVREVLLAREEPHERASLASPAIANRPAQHRVCCLERVEHAAERCRIAGGESCPCSRAFRSPLPSNPRRASLARSRGLFGEGR